MLKIILIGIISIILLFILSVFLFIKFAPQIGQQPKGEHLEKIQKSKNNNGDIFVNQIETNEASLGEALSTIPDFLFGENLSPDKPIVTDFPDNYINKIDSNIHITWYGHSAFLIEINNKRILLDPMFGESSSPIYLTTKRFKNTEKIDLEFFDNIDAVIISHDHYDHLDYPTIKKIKGKVKRFYTMLGVGSHLIRWGVDQSKIKELDWYDEDEFDEIKLIACPSRHFSGRGFSDRFKTLWGSWIIQFGEKRIYFSGDGGYGSHFQEIGAKYGPFDLAMIECGQYNKAWKDIHMMPEESVQAGLDLKAKKIMPIHWGAFQLSIHSWEEPARRFKKRSEELGAEAIFPKIGERFKLDSINKDLKFWL